MSGEEVSMQGKENMRTRQKIRPTFEFSKSKIQSSVFVSMFALLQAAAAAAAKPLQSCPTLCDPTDGSPPGSPVPGILQARTLERVPPPPPSVG